MDRWRAKFRGSRTQVARHGTYMIVTYTSTIASLTDFAYRVAAGWLVIYRGSLVQIIGFVTLAMLVGGGFLMRIAMLYEQVFQCSCFVEGTL